MDWEVRGGEAGEGEGAGAGVETVCCLGGEEGPEGAGEGGGEGLYSLVLTSMVREEL